MREFDAQLQAACSPVDDSSIILSLSAKVFCPNDLDDALSFSVAPPHFSFSEMSPQQTLLRYCFQSSSGGSSSGPFV